MNTLNTMENTITMGCRKGMRLSLEEAREACRGTEREGLLGMYPQAALRLEQELDCALARLDECRHFRDSAIRAMTQEFVARGAG